MRKLALLLFFFLLPACKDSVRHYNGYIDADLTYLSSNYAGRLANLAVVRGQSVQKNQLLFKLEQKSERYSVSTAKLTKHNLLSQRKEIIPKMQYAEINYRRTVQMRKHNVASQNDLDVAKKDLDVLKNQLIAIDFQIQSSGVDINNKTWQMDRKEGYATSPGIIFDTYFTRGEYAQAGQPVLSLITKQHIKVIFFVPENALSTILINQKVKISSDGNSEYATGTVRYISKTAQYTLPLIYSREERKDLVFRVEAHIDEPNLNQIHLGQPVSLELVT